MQNGCGQLTVNVVFNSSKTRSPASQCWHISTLLPPLSSPFFWGVPLAVQKRYRTSRGICFSSADASGALIFCVTTRSVGVWIGLLGVGLSAAAFLLVRSSLHVSHWPSGTENLLTAGGTGHRPLRLRCWCDRLYQYNFEVIYKPGSQNKVAGTLSRCYEDSAVADAHTPTNSAVARSSGVSHNNRAVTHSAVQAVEAGLALHVDYDVSVEVLYKLFSALWACPSSRCSRSPTIPTPTSICRRSANYYYRLAG